MKILLLEKEYSLCKDIKKHLKTNGHKVDSFDDGITLLDEANLFEYDFFVFNIYAPSIDGFEFLSYIRNKKIKTPLIFISDILDIKYITKAFNLGCSNYLKKPFHPRELELRLKNINNNFSTHEQIDLPKGLVYDFNVKSVFKNDNILYLSKKQSEILYLIMKHRGHVVTFDTIADYAYEGDFRDMHTISSHIRDIRKIVGLDIIKNVRGIGYQVAL